MERGGGRRRWGEEVEGGGGRRRWKEGVKGGGGRRCLNDLEALSCSVCPNTKVLDVSKLEQVLLVVQNLCMTSLSQEPLPSFVCLGKYGRHSYQARQVLCP